MKDRPLPVLKISRTKYNIDLDRLKLINVRDSSDEIHLEKFKNIILEDDFVIYFDENSQKIYEPQTPDGPFPAGIAIYRFDGIDMLDPVGYARLKGHGDDAFLPFYEARKLIIAERFPIPRQFKTVPKIPLVKHQYRNWSRGSKIKRRKR